MPSVTLAQVKAMFGPQSLPHTLSLVALPHPKRRPALQHAAVTVTNLVVNNILWCLFLMKCFLVIRPWLDAPVKYTAEESAHSILAMAIALLGIIICVCSSISIVTMPFLEQNNLYRSREGEPQPESYTARSGTDRPASTSQSLLEALPLLIIGMYLFWSKTSDTARERDRVRAHIEELERQQYQRRHLCFHFVLAALLAGWHENTYFGARTEPPTTRAGHTSASGSVTRRDCCIDPSPVSTGRHRQRRQTLEFRTTATPPEESSRTLLEVPPAAVDWQPRYSRVQQQEPHKSESMPFTHNHSYLATGPRKPPPHPPPEESSAGGGTSPPLTRLPMPPSIEHSSRSGGRKLSPFPMPEKSFGPSAATTELEKLPMPRSTMHLGYSEGFRPRWVVDGVRQLRKGNTMACETADGVSRDRPRDWSLDPVRQREYEEQGLRLQWEWIGPDRSARVEDA